MSKFVLFLTCFVCIICMTSCVENSDGPTVAAPQIETEAADNIESNEEITAAGELLKIDLNNND